MRKNYHEFWERQRQKTNIDSWAKNERKLVKNLPESQPDWISHYVESVRDGKRVLTPVSRPLVYRSYKENYEKLPEK